MNTLDQKPTQRFSLSTNDPTSECDCPDKDHFTCNRFYSCNDQRCFRFGCYAYLLKIPTEKTS